MMKKQTPDAKQVLKALGQLTEFLKALNPEADRDACFSYPLELIRQTLLFDISVLYKVSNVIEGMLILEVVKVLDPDKARLDLKEGRKLRLFLDARDKRYVNEVNAFATKKTSAVNVAGMGCDLVAYVFYPKDFGGAYLMGGDFMGKASGIRDFEVSAMDIMSSLLSSILLKTQFKQIAEYDDLTQLYNSAKIKDEARRILRRFRRKPGSVASIAMGDIDFFKKVNDTYGHIQGDLILKEVGRIISASLRAYVDLAGRYGGEEFMLVLDETGGPKAVQVVERIRKSVEATDFQKLSETGRPLEGQYLNITLSFGVAQVSSETAPPAVTDWIGRADKALYLSKNAGRNQTTLYSGDMD